LAASSAFASSDSAPFCGVAQPWRTSQIDRSYPTTLQRAAKSLVAPPCCETKRYFKMRVRDAGTLEAGLLPKDTVVIRLEGIDTREADETCKKENGTSWPCGAKARAALTLFIRSRAVTCTLPQGGATKDFAARCSVVG
jgi:endonuclease YncB( thermonuclease family)